MKAIDTMVPSFNNFIISENGHLIVDSQIDVLAHLRSLLPATVKRFKVEPPPLSILYIYTLKLSLASYFVPAILSLFFLQFFPFFFCLTFKTL